MTLTLAGCTSSEPQAINFLDHQLSERADSFAASLKEEVESRGIGMKAAANEIRAKPTTVGARLWDGTSTHVSRAGGTLIFEVTTTDLSLNVDAIIFDSTQDSGGLAGYKAYSAFSCVRFAYIRTGQVFLKNVKCPSDWAANASGYKLRTIEQFHPDASEMPGPLR